METQQEQKSEQTTDASTLVNVNDYESVYVSFMQDYKRGVTDGEMVGVTIAKLAQCYGTINRSLNNWSRVAGEKYSEILESTEPGTGKAISVAKASVVWESTEEYRKMNSVKIDLAIVDQYINALKYLQKGILNEYSHSGL